MSSIVEGSHFLRLTFSRVDVSYSHNLSVSLGYFIFISVVSLLFCFIVLGDVDIFCIAGLEVSIGLELGLGLVVSAFLTVILLVTSFVGAFLTVISLMMSFVGAFLQFTGHWLVICLC